MDVLARAVIRKWVRRIGAGFHPDSTRDNYEPALPAQYDRDMEFAHQELGEQIYDVAWEELHAHYRL